MELVNKWDKRKKYSILINYDFYYFIYFFNRNTFTFDNSVKMVE